jgi:hypothetical protein
LESKNVLSCWHLLDHFNSLEDANDFEDTQKLRNAQHPGLAIYFTWTAICSARLRGIAKAHKEKKGSTVRSLLFYYSKECFAQMCSCNNMLQIE